MEASRRGRPFKNLSAILATDTVVITYPSVVFTDHSAWIISKLSYFGNT
jgi:hypothetical protein